MEVMKSNLHMLETGKSVSKEKVLESEVNLEQSKPDLGQVYLPKAKMVVEELQPLEQTVLLRGYVQYRILYFTKEEDGKLVGLEGRIPVEESLALADISRLDELYSDVLMEDFSVLIVNPRKLVMRLGQYRDRCIHTHGTDALTAIFRHRKNAGLEFVIGIAKGFLHTLSFLIGILRHSHIWNL